MKIIIGCDHAGFLLKETITKYLAASKIDVIDVGCNSTDSVDYPDFAHEVVKSMSTNCVDLDILICGNNYGNIF